MNKEKLVSVLQDAGLSPYQAEAYVTILEIGASPATEIVKASDVPDPRIYDVLRDLESEGYVELYEQDSLHARAHSLDELKGDLETRATQFTAAADEIEQRWEQPAIEESVVSVVKRFDTVLNRADEYIRNGESQVVAAMSTSQYRALRPALETAAENGANVKITLFTGGEADDSLPPVEELAEVATEVRHRQLPSPFVAIVDRSSACFAPHASSTNRYGILVSDRTQTYVFYWFFLTTLWDICEPYYKDSNRDLYGDYVDIRYCIKDVMPFLQDGKTVSLLIDGYDTTTGDQRTVEGELADILISGSEYDADAPIAVYGGRVTMVVETEDGTVEVGGWGATVEEIESHRIKVLSVE